MAKDLCCLCVSACWYRVPIMDVISGIRILDKDMDILSMMEWIPTYRVIEIYLEHNPEMHEGDISRNEDERSKIQVALITLIRQLIITMVMTLIME